MPFFQRQPRGTRLRASVAVFALLLSMAAHSAAYKPTSADEVLLQVDAAQHQARLNLRATNGVADATTAAETASKFVALGRAQHDERYFGYASAKLQPWLHDSQAPTRIILLLADIAQYQHRFDDAVSILDDLIARDKNDVDAILMRASIRTAQGEPQKARADCQRLFASRETFIATVCLARSASLTGRLASSYQLLLGLLGRDSPSSANPQYVWALGIAADMAERSGDLTTSEKFLRKALALAPDDFVSRLQLCDLLLENQKPVEALQLLEGLSSSDPILMRRALAAKQMSDPVQARVALETWQTAVERSAQIKVTLHLRELARGQLELLNAPQLALQSALANWRVQREPIDARLLAQVARAAKNKDIMQRLRDWQSESHYEDARLTL